jgi:hypothetical protein
MSRSIHAAQGDSLPFNHHLHQFLTFLKHERGFADATIVNRERSLKPFLGWQVAQDVPLSTVSPVVIMPGNRAALRPLSPLRTGLESFPSSGPTCWFERGTVLATQWSGPKLSHTPQCFPF